MHSPTTPRQRRWALLAVASTLLAIATLAVAAPEAWGGSDVSTESFVVDETTVDEIASAFCGFPVEQHLQARVVLVFLSVNDERFLDLVGGPFRYTLTNLETGQSIQFLNTVSFQSQVSVDGSSFRSVDRLHGLNYVVRTSDGTFTSAGSAAYGLEGTVDEDGNLQSVDVFGHVMTAHFFHAFPVVCVLLGAVDSDHDYLPDSQGIRTEEAFRTDPHNPDTDGDGYLDGLEVANETDPRRAASHPTGAIGDPDKDDDFLNDGAEVLGYGTDPTDPDTDGDGFLDGLEVFIYNTDPTSRRSHP